MDTDNKKETVALFGASGSMGYEAFKELWKRRERYEITLLLLPNQDRDEHNQYPEDCLGDIAGADKD